MTVLIAGMHRSGTSATAAVMHALGFTAGDPSELLPATQDNQRGYFERRDATVLNEQILSTLGGSWLAPLGTPTEIAALADGPLGAQARRIVDSLPYGNRTLKDPRLCVTFPLWQQVLGDSIRAVVVPFRNPVQVAASLNARDGLPVRYGQLLWRTYHRHLGLGLAAVDTPVVLVDHQSLMQRDASTIGQLADLAKDPVDPQTLEAARNAIAPGEQRHHQPVTAHTLTPEAEHTYAALRRGTWPQIQHPEPTDEEQSALEVAAALGETLHDLQHERRRREALSAELDAWRSSTMGRLSTTVWDTAASVRRRRNR